MPEAPKMPGLFGRYLRNPVEQTKIKNHICIMPQFKNRAQAARLLNHDPLLARFYAAASSACMAPKMFPSVSLK